VRESQHLRVAFALKASGIARNGRTQTRPRQASVAVPSQRKMRLGPRVRPLARRAIPFRIFRRRGWATCETNRTSARV